MLYRDLRTVQITQDHVHALQRSFVHNIDFRQTFAYAVYGILEPCGLVVSV